ncbi:MAG: pitrilysin family protein [Alphaproteobacteria bacterium]|nr:pitrilysin family protein [Alphaproteobacteria bacterium]
MRNACAVLLFLLSFAVPAEASTVRIQEVTSPGGIKAWLVQDGKLPLIAMRFAFRGGVEQDPFDKQGLAELTASLLTEGAGPYDSEAFQQTLADQSIQMGISAGRDAIRGSLKTLSATKETAFKLLRLALAEPRFDADAVARVRNQQLTQLRLELGSPDWQARHALFAHVFKGHPYAMRRLGTTQTLKSLTRDDVKTFAAEHLARDNLLVAVTGDISPGELAKRLDEIFGALPAHAQLTPVGEAAWPEKPAVILVPREGTQTDMLFAVPMLRRDDPDWYAAEIVNYILGGGGFSSRLMHEVREAGGLTYGIHTALAPMDFASVLIGEAAADNPKAGKAWEATEKVWRGLYENGVTDEEIGAAKDYLTGSLPLKLTSTGAIAGVLLEMQLDKLGRDYLDRRDELIRRVSAEDVHRVIQRWFNPGGLTLALAGEPEGVTPTITKEPTKE